VAEHTQPAHVPKTFSLTSESRKHIFEGEINRHGEATGFHHEPSGQPNKGPYVIEETRSAVDKHRVYTADVVVKGKRKDSSSTFFPQEWTQAQVESEIAHAYKNGIAVDGPHVIEGYASNGMKIRIRTNGAGTITTAHPIKGKGR
jgi:hypothetical protein